MSVQTIADRIRMRREELELTQDQLAKRMGYAVRTTVSNVESSGDEVSLKKIKKFAEALNVTESYLMGLFNDENVYKNEDLDMLDRFKTLSASNKNRIIKLIDLMNLDDTKYTPDTDILDIYISEEEKRKEKKRKMLDMIKAD